MPPAKRDSDAGSPRSSPSSQPSKKDGSGVEGQAPPSLQSTSSAKSSKEGESQQSLKPSVKDSPQSDNQEAQNDEKKTPGPSEYNPSSHNSPIINSQTPQDGKKQTLSDDREDGEYPALPSSPSSTGTKLSTKEEAQQSSKPSAKDSLIFDSQKIQNDEKQNPETQDDKSSTLSPTKAPTTGSPPPGSPSTHKPPSSPVSKEPGPLSWVMPGGFMHEKEAPRVEEHAKEDQLDTGAKGQEQTEANANKRRESLDICIPKEHEATADGETPAAASSLPTPAPQDPTPVKAKPSTTSAGPGCGFTETPAIRGHDEIASATSIAFSEQRVGNYDEEFVTPYERIRQEAKFIPGVPRGVPHGVPHRTPSPVPIKKRVHSWASFGDKIDSPGAPSEPPARGPKAPAQKPKLSPHHAPKQHLEDGKTTPPKPASPPNRQDTGDAADKVAKSAGSGKTTTQENEQSAGASGHGLQNAPLYAPSDRSPQSGKGGGEEDEELSSTSVGMPQSGTEVANPPVDGIKHPNRREFPSKGAAVEARFDPKELALKQKDVRFEEEDADSDIVSRSPKPEIEGSIHKEGGKASVDEPDVKEEVKVSVDKPDVKEEVKATDPASVSRSPKSKIEESIHEEDFKASVDEPDLQEGWIRIKDFAPGHHRPSARNQKEDGEVDALATSTSRSAKSVDLDLPGKTDSGNGDGSIRPRSCEESQPKPGVFEAGLEFGCGKRSCKLEFLWYCTHSFLVDQATAWEEFWAMIASGSNLLVKKSRQQVVFPSKLSLYILVVYLVLACEVPFLLAVWEERRKWELANGVTRRYLLDSVYGSKSDWQSFGPDWGLGWQVLYSLAFRYGG